MNQQSPELQQRHEVHLDSTLKLSPPAEGDADARLSVLVAKGSNVVVVIQRERPARTNTYDTGGYEELYLEFNGTPAKGVRLQADRALAAALYQYGSSVLIYQSKSVGGTVLVKEWKPGQQISCQCDLLFTAPSFDRVNVGNVRVDMGF